MCGIGGIWHFDGTLPQDSAVRGMLAALRHRGPDGHGVWRSGTLTMVHTRLSIIDLQGSAQPMTSAHGDSALVFNGEILNYRDLRNRFDYPYRTDGDTETILAAHSNLGPDAPATLRGQFAYALFEHDHLTLVRDRLGILPLYWYHDGNRLLFGSEVAAILAALDHPPELDPGALDAYLTGRSVPAPATLLRGIAKLAPGHRLEIRTDGSWREARYWSPEGREVAPISTKEAVDRLDHLVDSAVRRALIADVPVGAYLSGGVDSSLIATRAASLSSHRMHTYCAGFGDPRNDETPLARQLADTLGTTHHTVQVRPGDFGELWQTLSLRRGAPLSEPADIAVFRLAQAAREDVKVVLSGEGSDELFAGYPKHRYARATVRAGLLPAAVRAPLLASTQQLMPARGRRLRVALRALAEPTAAQRRRAWFAPFTSAERIALLGRTSAPEPAGPGKETGTEHLSPLRAMLLDDLRAWLPDNLLERGDRMTMAASVELRPPFLDEDVVEFSLSVPDRLLVRAATTKWLLKQVARRHLPAAVVDRRKAGFKVPLDAWFRGQLYDLAQDLVNDSSSITRTHLDRAAVAALFAAHRGGNDESIRIWTLASLEMWHHSLRESGRPGPIDHDALDGPTVDHYTVASRRRTRIA